VSVPVHRAGTCAVLVDLPDLATSMSWHAALSASPLTGQVEVGAAARTVLVRFNSPTSARASLKVLSTFIPDKAATSEPRDITVDVVYDGCGTSDLDELAEHLGMTRNSLIDWHSSTTWTAAFGGFAPGFTYCVPADGVAPLNVPRRGSPRTAVPDGAVALAGEFSAVYPRTSPGGWQLIGTTTRPFWDTTAEDPALLSPGDRVHYRPVTEHIDITAQPESGGAETTTPRRPVLRLDDPGLQVLVEDSGRPGHGDLGVTGSGAADQGSASAANEALGNAVGSAVLENIGGLTATALSETVVVVTGAPTGVLIDGRRTAHGVPLLLRSGASLTVGPATTGLRSYIGVRGGIVAEKVLASASADLLSGLGPAPFSPGDVIYAGRAVGSVRPITSSICTDGVLRVIPGPRDDWFTDGVDALTGRAWTVSEASNRVGLRLHGEEHISRARDGEIPSEGMVPGSVQVPPNGEPVVFLRDHAVTGGYPVIATVIAEDLDAAAQLPPGATVTFVVHQEKS
jgi:KipI family sensor histidine kinase inhibitor